MLIKIFFNSWIYNSEDDTTLLKKADNMSGSIYCIYWDYEYINNSRVIAYIIKRSDNNELLKELEKLKSQTYQVNRIKYFLTN